MLFLIDWLSFGKEGEGDEGRVRLKLDVVEEFWM